MRGRKAVVTGLVTIVTLSGCSATMREGHPEDIPTWWSNYHGPNKTLNVILEGDLDDDHEWFREKCFAMGNEAELIIAVDQYGNWTKATCEKVDY